VVSMLTTAVADMSVAIQYASVKKNAYTTWPTLCSHGAHADDVILLIYYC